MWLTPQEQQSCLPPLFCIWKCFQSSNSKTTTGKIFAQQLAFLVGAKLLCKAEGNISCSLTQDQPVLLSSHLGMFSMREGCLHQVTIYPASENGW